MQLVFPQRPHFHIPYPLPTNSGDFLQQLKRPQILQRTHRQVCEMTYHACNTRNQQQSYIANLRITYLSSNTDCYPQTQNLFSVLLKVPSVSRPTYNNVPATSFTYHQRGHNTTATDSAVFYMW